MKFFEKIFPKGLNWLFVTFFLLISSNISAQYLMAGENYEKHKYFSKNAAYFDFLDARIRRNTKVIFEKFEININLIDSTIFLKTWKTIDEEVGIDQSDTSIFKISKIEKLQKEILFDNDSMSYQIEYYSAKCTCHDADFYFVKRPEYFDDPTFSQMIIMFFHGKKTKRGAIYFRQN